MWNHIIAFGLASVLAESCRGMRAGPDEEPDRFDQISPRSEVPSGWNGRSIALMLAEAFRNQSICELEIRA